MFTELKQLVDKIPKLWQLVLTVLGILGVGFTGGMSFVNIMGLPADVQAQEERLAAVEETVADWRPIMRQMPDMIARINELADGLNQANQNIRLNNCLNLAEQRGEPYQQCLDMAGGGP